jgi:hypothetical protein
MKNLSIGYTCVCGEFYRVQGGVGVSARSRKRRGGWIWGCLGTNYGQ